MKTAWRTHVGKVRHVNEDRAWSGRLADGWTGVIVADGMGGHRAGDVASELAVGCLADALQFWNPNQTPAEAEAALQEMINKANRVVYETASLNEEYHNMGTTVVVAVMSRDGGFIGHVGDSRIYRLRGSRLEQLTDDHTVINELSKSGQLSPEEAARHPLRHAITRSVGTERDVKADIMAIDWMPGDRLLLCSDGLSGLVEETMLQQTLAQTGATLEEVADRLVEMALDAGGDDNVTVVLVEADEAAAAGGETA
ncbi:Stp1/IreP family PP2C-type Ser/Thr phosphatase [Cohnella pontilimi]|uniref:Stp1/IreP family PP2C-type Ser/Thr phosphatase n=1 Tax=Cohnella pontilimi TaxID=2564100 RepID=A0A4U0FII3_9BACL|nr:Stp1/IreP family PP2C-type Ser/Thr phosphatase [Cohnella pontilimi]TJY43252.1 Stp1/IreP family PP2C-type Ser/Thr phosphatase [Cohnella pontilimi]